MVMVKPLCCETLEFVTSVQPPSILHPLPSSLKTNYPLVNSGFQAFSSPTFHKASMTSSFFHQNLTSILIAVLELSLTKSMILFEIYTYIFYLKDKYTKRRKDGKCLTSPGSFPNLHLPKLI